MSDEESDATNEISDGDTTADDDDGAADRILRFFYGDICIFVLKDVPAPRGAPLHYSTPTARRQAGQRIQRHGGWSRILSGRRHNQITVFERRSGTDGWTDGRTHYLEETGA